MSYLDDYETRLSNACDSYAYPFAQESLAEADARIAELEAELERRKTRNLAEQVSLTHDIHELKQDNARLRAALEAIAAPIPSPIDGEDMNTGMHALRARQALWPYTLVFSEKKREPVYGDVCRTRRGDLFTCGLKEVGADGIVTWYGPTAEGPGLTYQRGWFSVHLTPTGVNVANKLDALKDAMGGAG